MNSTIGPQKFSNPGIDPFDEVKWEKRTAEIIDDKNRVVFRQADVLVPSFWSQLATNVVVSKYFYGEQGTSERENSVRQLQQLNRPGFAIHLEQVGELANASAIVYPGGFRFRRGNQPLLLRAFSRLIQPGVVHLSGFVDCLIQFLLTDSMSLTFLFEPAQDSLQLAQQELLHRASRWFSPEGTALVETLSR